MTKFKANAFLDKLIIHVKHKYGEDLALEGLREMVAYHLNGSVSDDLSERIEKISDKSKQALLEEIDSRLSLNLEKPAEQTLKLH